MMIRITQLKLPVDHTPMQLQKKIASLLRCGDAFFTYEIQRRSLDARDKENKHFVYTVDVKISQEKKVMRRAGKPTIVLSRETPYRFPDSKDGPGRRPERPVVVGSGPAGLFCAWYLAKAGMSPLVIERGQEAALRKEKVDRFWKEGLLDPECNVQFGEGGAGTFSDGKLNTLVKDPKGRNHEVLKRFVEAGAPASILYESKPHLGTDVLVRLVTVLREQIQDMGGSFLFGTKAKGLVLQAGRLAGVEVEEKLISRVIPADACVLAIGHSARDTFSVLMEQGLAMEAKAFAVGFRIEHLQERINIALYGEKENRILGPAAYKLTHTLPGGRGVYSFCMCPGGYVVNASSQEEGLCVNGMSYSDRSGVNANSAIVITVRPEDFSGEGCLAGVAFQKKLEAAAGAAAGGKIPVQRFGDYCLRRVSTGWGSIEPQTRGSYAPGNVRQILPPLLADGIEEGIRAFGKKIPGFDDPDVLLSGVESRTSSPVRILRDPVNLMSSIPGIYPCGEGAGYAGGITSAAMDGLKVAEVLVQGGGCSL